MKKKIIYFCAGVLLTSLILIALQTYATAPNPGHDTTQISGGLDALTAGGKSLVYMHPWTFTPIIIVAPAGTYGSDACAALGLTCTTCPSAYYGGSSLAYCTDANSHNFAQNCTCDCISCYMPLYK